MVRKQLRLGMDLSVALTGDQPSERTPPDKGDRTTGRQTESEPASTTAPTECPDSALSAAEPVASDVSRHGQANEQLARINSELRAVIDSVESAVVITDRSGRVEYANKRFVDMFGLDPTYLASHPLHQDLVERIKSALKDPETFAQIDAYAHQHPERPVRDEIEVVRPRHRCVDHATLPIYDDRTVIGQIEVFRDVTAEQEARRTEEDFLSLVSHEFRTPLTTIIGNLDFVMRSIARRDLVRTSELLPRLQQTVTAAHRAEAMVGQLLDVIAIDSGRLVMHRRPIRPEKLLRSMLARLHPLTIGRDVRISVAADLPQVLADPRRLEQALGSLIGNAVKYSAPGTPIDVSLQRRADRADMIVFSVTDHGEGIAAADIDRLFDRFARLKHHYAAREGLGLGLYIAEQIVTAHGGRIEVESQPGVGSTFRVVLPVYRPPS